MHLSTPSPPPPASQKKRLPFSAPIQFIPEPVSPGLSSHLVEQFGPSIWEILPMLGVVS